MLDNTYVIAGMLKEEMAYNSVMEKCMLQYKMPYQVCVEADKALGQSMWVIVRLNRI